MLDLGCSNGCSLVLGVDPRRTDHIRGASGVIEEICASSGPSSRIVPDSLGVTMLISLQVTQSDSVEEQENAEDIMGRLGSRSG